MKKRPLVSAVLPASELQRDFSDGIFAKKCVFLGTKYRGVIQLRRDGNCFVRAFATGVLLYLKRCSDEAERERVIRVFADSLSFVCEKGGYESFVVEVS